MSVVHCCVCVCLSCDAHCFSWMGITEGHVQLRLSQLAPSPRAWHPVAPDTYHLLGSTTTESRVLLLSVVFVLRPHCRALCQVLACWSHEGSNCGASATPWR